MCRLSGGVVTKIVILTQRPWLVYISVPGSMSVSISVSAPQCPCPCGDRVHVHVRIWTWTPGMDTNIGRGRIQIWTFRCLHGVEWIPRQVSWCWVNLWLRFNDAEFVQKYSTMTLRLVLWCRVNFCAFSRHLSFGEADKIILPIFVIFSEDDRMCNLFCFLDI